MTNNDEIQQLKEFSLKIQLLRERISKVIVGQDQIVQELIITLIAQGHLLLVGVPGLAKTLLISTVAQLFDLRFNRVQFTPDLMPSDIIGTEVLEKKGDEKSFRFIRGPVFCNLLLADEINRTPPKTQSALLQAMQEYRISYSGVTYPLDKPFFVLATQNPIELEGTYPLPEAQLDRFLLNSVVSYPSFEEEVEIMKRTTGDEITALEPILLKDDILNIQALVRRIPVSDFVIEYATRIVTGSRPDCNKEDNMIKNYVSWGAGPRATQSLILSSKALAAIRGKTFVEIDEIKTMAYSVLRHRILLNFSADSENIRVEDIISHLLQIKFQSNHAN